MKYLGKIFILILLIDFSLNFAQSKIEKLKRDALVQMQAGKYGEAIDLLNKYISQNARYAEGYYLRGLSHEKREEYQSAVLDFRRAVKLNPTKEKYKTSLGRVWNDWSKILYKRIEGYKREIAINSANPLNYLEIGKSFRWLEEWSSAEKWYDTYLSKDPVASADEILRYTEILSHTGSIKKGEKKLKEYINRYPDDWRLLSRYGYFTMWLGNYQIAERAFKTALNFKPFFKEAQDGLDLALRKGYLVKQSPRSFERDEYLIDRYYRILKNDPNNDDLRFQLVQSLLDAKRYEEAFQQLNYLKPNNNGTVKFAEIKEKVVSHREKYYRNKIDSVKRALQNKQDDQEILLRLVSFYMKLDDNKSAENTLLKYLQDNPGNNEVRFQLAKIYSYQHKFSEAAEEMNRLLKEDSNNYKYLLLAGQLAVWKNERLDLAESYLKRVLQSEPENLQANIAMGTLNFQQEDYKTAQQYSDKALQISPDDSEAQQLHSMLKLYFLRERIQQNLEQGRKLAAKGEYEEAILFYNKYCSETHPTPEIKFELADVYTGAKKYKDAIEIYDQVLSESYNSQMDKQRAKVIFWSDDSVRALDEFKRLVKVFPEDQEVQLYLGDTYTKMKMYENARIIYKKLIKEGAPDSFVIEKRLSWLPASPASNNIFRSIGNNFLSYLFVQPMSYYYSDNIDFQYKFIGGNLETSFLPYLGGGITWIRGKLDNKIENISYTTIKGNIYFKPSENLLFTFSYGEMNSQNIVNTPVVEAAVKYEHKKEKNDKYGFSINYLRSDASTFLYSPDLIFTRITGQLGTFTGYYDFISGAEFELKYNLIHTSAGFYNHNSSKLSFPHNFGNSLTARLGRRFYPNLLAGYEYYFSDFEKTLPVYYSPKDFNQHSIFTELTIFKDDQWNFLIGGKVGYIPKFDFLLREVKTRISFQVNNMLKFLLSGFIGDTIREKTEYSSASVSLEGFWSIY